MQLPPFRLERYFARYEFAAEFLLGSSDCESWSVQELLDLEPGAAAAFAAQRLGYTESAGSPTLRAAIAALYATATPQDILVHSGAEEAIFLFMHAMLQPGDHVIVHWPCYQSLTDVARSLGCEVSLWRAHAGAGWALDLDELAAAIRPNTRAVVLNTPHNPTGYLMAPDDYAALHRLAQAHGLLLFSDEVYRELEHRPADRLPAACDLGDHAVSLGVLSKSYGLAGLRIGWVATHNQDVLQRMARLKDYTTICNSAPSEFLAELALRRRQTLLARNLAIIAANLDALDAFFARYASRFAWQRPHAGSVAFPRLRTGTGTGDAEAYCTELVQQTGVMLVPGTVFGDTGFGDADLDDTSLDDTSLGDTSLGDIGSHFRLGFGRKNLPAALARWDARLAGDDVG